MINWFTSLTPEQQVGLLTLILTIVGGVLVKGRGPKDLKPHKENVPPALAEITCGYMQADHDRIERLEDSIRVIRETQIEILTLVRQMNRG